MSIEAPENDSSLSNVEKCLSGGKCSEEVVVSCQLFCEDLLSTAALLRAWRSDSVSTDIRGVFLRFRASNTRAPSTSTPELSLGEIGNHFGVKPGVR